jgi:hypothetical protein
MTLCACSTAAPPAQPIKPQISEALRRACEPLPPLDVKPGEQDMRPELLRNRAAAERTHSECTARHRGVLRAVGVEPSELRAARQAAIKAQRAHQTTTTEE